MMMVLDSKDVLSRCVLHRAVPAVVVLHCLHCRSNEGNFGASTVAHLAEGFQGLPDAHAFVKYLTPKSKVVAQWLTGRVLIPYCVN
jgi:hypothetical protein